MAPSSAAALAPFRERLTLAERRAECERVRRRHPRHVAVILEPGARDAPPIDKQKFLVPEELTLAHLAFAARRRLELRPEQALFLHAEGGALLDAAAPVRALRERRTAEDGFVYVTYSLENAFGGAR